MKTTFLIFLFSAFLFIGMHSTLTTFAGVKQEKTSTYSTQQIEKIVDYDTAFSHFVAANAAPQPTAVQVKAPNYENPPEGVSEFIIYLLSAATGLVAILLRALIKRIWPNFEFDKKNNSRY